MTTIKMKFLFQDQLGVDTVKRLSFKPKGFNLVERFLE